MERTRGIEPPSQPWQGRILTIKPHSQLEGLDGFEPTIKVLQTHALPLGYNPMYLKLYQTLDSFSIIFTIFYEKVGNLLFFPLLLNILIIIF